MRLVVGLLALLTWLPGAGLACALALAGLAWWWSGQPGSLQTTVNAARPWVAALAPLQLQAPQASLRHGGAVDRLDWQQADGLSVQAQDLTLAWQWPTWREQAWQPLRWQLTVDRLTVDDRRPSQPPEPPGAPAGLDALALPLPLDGTLHVATARLAGQPRWSLTQLQLHHTYSTASHRHTLQAQVQSPENGTGYRLDATLDSQAPYPLAATLDARWTPRHPPNTHADTVVATAHGTLQLDGALAGDAATLDARLTIAATPNTAGNATHAQATARLHPWQAQALTELNAQAQALDLSAWLPGLPHTRLSGHAHLTPSPTEPTPDSATAPGWQLDMDLRNATPGPWDTQRLPLNRLQLQAQGQPDAGQLTQLQASLTTGQLRAQGRWRGAPWQPQSWQGRADLDGVPTTALHSGWPMRVLNGHLSAQPTAPDGATAPAPNPLQAPTRLDLTVTASPRLDQKSSKQSNGDKRREHFSSQVEWSAHRVNVVSAQGTLAGAGLQGRGLWQRTGPDAPWTTQGELTVDVPQADTVRAWLQPWLPAGQDTPVTGHALLQARWDLPRLQASLSGQLARGQVQGDLDLALDGDWTLPTAVQARVQRLDLALGTPGQPQAGRWRLEGGGLPVSWGPTGLQWGAGRLQWQGAGAVPATTAATLGWQASGWQDGVLATQGDITGLGLPQLDGLWQLAGQPALAFTGDVRLDGRWTVRWPLGDATDGAPQLDLQIGRTSGDLHWPMAGTTTPISTASPAAAPSQPVGLSALQLVLQGDARRLTVRLDAEARLLGRLQARIGTQLPVAGHSALDGQLALQLPELARWERLAPPGWRLSGQAELQAQLSGTLQQPRWQGELTGQQLGLRSAVEGLSYGQGTIKARLSGQRLELLAFSLQGEGGEQRGGRLDVSGHVDWPDLGAPPDIQLTATARALNVSARADRRLVLSGDVRAGWQAGSPGPSQTPAQAPGLLTLRGQLKADQVQFTLPDETAPAQGSDVVVRQTRRTDTLPSTRAPWQADVDLSLDLGPACTVQGQGLSTQLAGQLRLTRSPAAPTLRVVGEVRTVRGSYRAYGQTLNIQEGVLRFSGPYDDPALDILALRPAGRAFETPTDTQQQVGVKVIGSARQPRVQLYAQPDLPDSDKLAWLLLGRPASGVGAEAAVMQQAAMAMLAGGSGPGLDARLARALGLDDVALRSASSNGQGTTTDASLLLGKRLSSRLYVAYEQSLSGTMSAISLFYDLSRRLTLRARAGQTQSIDLIATVPHD